MEQNYLCCNHNSTQNDNKKWLGINPPDIQKLIDEGSLASINELIVLHRKIPYYVAKRNRPERMEFEEAVSIANESLCKSVRKYVKNPLENYALSTCIFYGIRWGFSYKKIKHCLIKDSVNYEEYFENTLSTEIETIQTNNEQTTEFQNIARHLLSNMEEEKVSFLKKHYGIDCKKMTIREIAKELNIPEKTAQSRHLYYKKRLIKEYESHYGQVKRQEQKKNIDYVTIDEAMLILGVTVKTVRTYRRKGFIKAVMVKNKLFYEKDTLVALKEKRDLASTL